MEWNGSGRNVGEETEPNHNVRNLNKRWHNFIEIKLEITKRRSRKMQKKKSAKNALHRIDSDSEWWWWWCCEWSQGKIDRIVVYLAKKRLRWFPTALHTLAIFIATAFAELHIFKATFQRYSLLAFFMLLFSFHCWPTNHCHSKNDYFFFNIVSCLHSLYLRLLLYSNSFSHRAHSMIWILNSSLQI